MIPIQDYENAIRARVCAVCIDRSSDGTCAVTNHPELTCVLETMLPRVIEAIRKNPNANAQELDLALREIVCKECREDERGYCKLREEVQCALDRYFPLVVQTVEGVRGRKNGLSATQAVNYHIPARAIEEHHVLDRAQRRLLAVANQCKREPGGPAYALLLQTLRAFRSSLFAHLAYEEEDGFMKPVLEIRPTLSPVIERLKSEHEQLRSDVETYIAALEQPGSVAPTQSQIPGLVLSMLTSLKLHENMENGVILEAFVRDIGNTD